MGYGPGRCAVCGAWRRGRDGEVLKGGPASVPAAHAGVSRQTSRIPLLEVHRPPGRDRRGPGDRTSWVPQLFPRHCWQPPAGEAIGQRETPQGSTAESRRA